MQASGSLGRSQRVNFQGSLEVVLSGFSAVGVQGDTRLMIRLYTSHSIRDDYWNVCVKGCQGMGQEIRMI